MIEIEYSSACVGDVTVSMAWPQVPNSNSNQYLFDICGLKDYLATPATIMLRGDWEYQAFRDCLSKAQSYVLSGAKNLKKTFTSGVAATIDLEIRQNADKLGMYRLKFTFRDYCQIPVSNGAYWKKIKHNEFAFYASTRELNSIFEALAKIEEGYAPISMLALSRAEEWALPRRLYDDSPVIAAALGEKAVAAISELRPTALQSKWINLIRVNFTEFVKHLDTCNSCKGLFVKDIYWKSKCLGCYLGKEPTAWDPDSASSVELMPWLVSPLSEANDAGSSDERCLN